MSAHPDVTLIQDEDVLRKMWQDTEDFGRKKEIRTHMYKIREARLKDFYSTGEVGTEIKRTTSETCGKPTHADLLADHSFLSLKSKEIRDSESPTRDMNYKVMKHNDNGWNVVTSNERSEDGKQFTTKRSATTSGSQQFDGGKVDYAARNDQKTSVYQDGDDRNFVKAVGAESHSVIKQEAVGGDNNSNFKTTSTKTSSSSRVVTESRSTSGDVVDKVPAITSSTQQIRGKEIPEDVKNHPSYVEGKTKVFRETKTLGDGSTVVTTRYETVGGSTSQQSTRQQHTSSSSVKEDRRQSNVRRSSNTDSIETTRKEVVPYVDANTKVYKETKTLADGSTVTTTRYENVGSTSTHKTTQQRREQPVTYVDDNTRVYKETKTLPDGSTVTTTKYETRGGSQHSTSTSKQQVVHESHHSSNRNTTDYSNKAIEFVVDERTPTAEITIKVDKKPSKETYTTTKTTTVYNEVEPVVTTKTVTNQRSDNKQTTNEFINIEQQQEKQTRETIKRPQSPERPLPTQREPSPKYDTPEKRQPIKPGKSELDRKPEPNEGQYDTTYRSEFTPKKISVEVSATHDAFARSLRAVSPDRISHRGSVKSLRTSTSSLRSSTSPEKQRVPARYSPERPYDRNNRSVSPRKTISTETITIRTNRTSPVKTTNKPNGYPSREIDSNTITRRKGKPRSPSPSTTASDIEYFKNTDQVTDLDDETITVTTKNIRNTTVTKKDVRPSSLEITTKKTRKVTERSPTSPLTDFGSPKRSPTKELPRRNSFKSPVKETTPKPFTPSLTTTKKELPKDRPLKRTDTYEERCRQILGITETAQERRRSSLEKASLRRDSLTKTTVTKKSSEKPKSPTKESPERPFGKSGSPTKSPTKEVPLMKDDYPEKRRPSKTSPTIGEFPSQIRRSPEKEPLEPYPEKKRPSQTGPTISEFPSQIRRSPEREPLEPYPEKRRPSRTSPSIEEFPSQIRRSPEREPLEPYPEKQKPSKTAPTICEFPSQVRKSPEKEPLEPYPEKRRPSKTGQSIDEFPSQIRRSPEREPLESYPKKQKPSNTAPTICEFPSQIRKTPEKEPLEPYPEKHCPSKTGPSIDEFPSQIRRSPEREPLEPYPEKRHPSKTAPSIDEFPSQIRRSPEREPLGPYPDKQKPSKTAPTICEFPSQVRKSPEKEPLEPYTEKRRPSKPAPSIDEFPSQIRRSPEREPLEPYPEKQKPIKTTPVICEFPSQVRKSPEKEPLEPYPEKRRPSKTASSIDEFPSQIRRSPEREPLEPYPEKQKPSKTAPTICEFPSQVRKLPEREPLEPYPENRRPSKTTSSIDEFPSQIRRSHEREPLEPYTEKQKPSKTEPTICEFPSQVRKSPERKPLEPYPEKQRPIKTIPSVDEYPSQTRKLPEKQPGKPEKLKPKTVATVSKVTPKRKSPRKKTTSTSSSTSEEDTVEEVLVTTTATYNTSTIPVNEPMVTEKFISQLCREDDVKTKKTTTSTTKTKKDVEQLLEQEIIANTVPTNKGKPLKKRPTNEFISNERTHTETTTITRKAPTKPAEPSKVPTKKKPFKPGTTEYTDEFGRPKTVEPRKPQKTVEKITLWNVENLSDAEEDTTVHIRTHRIDETTKTKPVPKVNGIPKKTAPLKKPTTTVPKQPKTIHKTTLTTTVDNSRTKTTRTVTPKKTTLATITVTPVKKSQPKTKGPVKSKPLQNGHVSTEEDSDADSVIDLTTKKTCTNKVTRTTSDQIIKTQTKPRTPVRGFSKPELISKPTKKTETKCITTKSIIINNQNKKSSDQREVVIDLLRSTSSREPTPDRLCPLPVSSDEELGNTPRYPDEVTEPEDGNVRKPKKLSDIPLMENDDDYQYTRITDITDNKKITEVDRVEETDDSLLTVEKKISKFLTTAEEVTKKPLKPKAPAPKKNRPDFEVDEDLRSDECLLSVSDKVTKFITTAEQLTAPQPNLDRPKSPICRNYVDEEDFANVEVSRRVSHFINTAEETVKPAKKPSGPAPKVSRPQFEDVDEKIKDDDCLLSVSDKVSKFITTADTLTKPLSETTTTTRKSVTIETEDRRSPSKSPSPTRRTPVVEDNEKTPNRRPSNQYSSINRSETETTTTRRTSTEFTPTTTRKPAAEPPKSPTTTSTRIRTNESVKKTKALFENISKEQEILKQRDILSRPSVFEGRKLQNKPATAAPTVPKLKKRLSFSDDEETTVKTDTTLKSTKLVIDKMFVGKEPEVPGYMKPLDRNVKPTRPQSPEKIPEIVTTETYERSERESSPEGDLPGYMKPLDRTLRPHSPHREALNNLKKAPSHEPIDEGRPTKFGVTLKRTDSGRTGTTSTVMTTSTTERRKSSITLEKRITEEEVEEIFELEILEELLEKVVGYDLRRKIRAQIRLVKKLIQENKLSEYITSRSRTSPRREPSPTKFKPEGGDNKRYPTEYIRKTSPERKIVDSKSYEYGDKKKYTEYQTEYVRKTSPERKVVNNKLYEHSDFVGRQDDSVRKTEYQSSYKYDERRSSSEYRRSPSPKKEVTVRLSPERKTVQTTTTTTTTTKSRLSPEKTTTTTTITKTRLSPERKPDGKSFTALKKTVPVTKQQVVDDKPEWVKQRNLRKVTDQTPIKKVATTKTTTTTNIRRVNERSPSPQKDVKPTDIITSSYGVGPTDENGAPLFGLRALRAQNKTEKTKVQGTVIRSEYYSENGNEPVGQISVTKYSSDPKDLGSNEDLRSNNKGVTSVTTTQKFGYRDTPSLRSLTDKKKAITSNENESTSTTTKTTSKVTRRGSVKQLSQKFIENAVETLKNEKQSSYPKAGLILRTSSFKGTGDSDESRETSPVEENTVTTVKTTQSFLTNRSEVTGMQDIMGRMKAEDYEVEGDTEEEVKAKGLLNKFLGAQVILNALEGSSKTTTTKTSSPTSSVKRTTKVTSTITERGKPRTVERVFQRPVTEKDLETVWDEQTLRLLLDQSTDYEERRILRARLRQVMAEQEACAELVEKASQEQSGGGIEEKVETTKKTVSSGPVTTTQVTTRVTTQQMAKKPISPFAKFRQLDKQNSLPSSPSTPKTPSGSGPLFKFTDPALSQSANTIKERLLYWCKQKTKEYENIQLDNFSTSWADGLAFCALIHHFVPDAFDYNALSPKNRRHNFTLAFRVADEKADIFPLLDVDDMVACRKPDWKCVFTYVQSIYRRFKDED